MASISVSSAFSRCCASLAASLGSIAAKSYERGKTAIHESERGLVPTAGYGVNAWPSRKHNGYYCGSAHPSVRDRPSGTM